MLRIDPFRAVCALAAACLLAPAAAQAQLRFPRPSPAASVAQTVGLNRMTITYSRPGVRGRKIWGGLVPYGQMWRTGANEATAISFSEDVVIDGQTLPAGAYALFTIPDETEWTLIFNKNAKQNGTADYKESEDALRLKVRAVAGPHQEWMEFRFEDLTPDQARVVLAWDNLEVPFVVHNKVATSAAVMEGAKKAVAEAKPDDWMTLYRAASYSLNNNVETELGRAWLQESLAIRETPQNLFLKANTLAREGKKEQAAVTAQKALDAAGPGDSKEFLAEIRKQLEEWRK
jgi:Protein of unknown function (DUF2911)